MARNDRILLDGIVDDRIAIKIPSEKRDEAFEFLALEQILKDRDLSSDEIQGGIIDGRQDGGIDGVFTLVNGHLLNDPESFVWPRTGSELHVYIVTCKHHDTFKQATLDNLAASLTELLDFEVEDDKLRGAYSSSLLRFRNNLKFAYRRLSPRLSRFAVSIYYASRGDTAEIGSEVKARADHVEAIVRDCFGNCACAFSFVGSAELVDLHRQMPSYALELPFLEALARGERYVVLARLSDYCRFVTDGHGRLRRYLFDSNVRDFMGLNRVNEDICRTLEDETSPDFWWLNNGVTILATSASVVGKAIKIQDIQIVNGLQTTESIFRYVDAGGKDPSDRCVLVKVIVSRDEAVRDAIIRATNNQTNVELASLHATDKVQRDIEDVMLRRGLFYERRKNYYRNVGRAPEEIITPLYVAAGYISLILKSPASAATIRSKFMRSSTAYESVFSIRAPLEVWPQIALILKKTDAGLETVRPKAKGTERFLKSWRHITSFLLVSRALGKFDFTAAELIKFDAGSITESAVGNMWSILHSYAENEGLSFEWSSRLKILAACALFARDNAISGFNEIADRVPLVTEGTFENRAHLSAGLIDRVKAVMPPQPWKPGLHRRISAALGCSTASYFAAVKALIEDGHFYQQKDGVLYDVDGNVVGYDADRIDPTTMRLRGEEEV